MKTAYIDYSMSVIVARALPDVRDGLKPVHRRVLFGMHELGVGWNKPYKKSARIVGEVLGKYHPHGDTSVYDAMVRLAQDWSMRYTLVDGQGNYGSIDGDSPAAMRYTEARLTKMAEEMIGEIDQETVDFQNNFDDSLQEPKVLPAKIPNLLVNGASGIAVGMATNMAPHNLREICQAIIAYINNKEITVEELLPIVKGPDFPTGAIIYGYEGVKQALLTGRGRVVMRAKSNIETLDNGRERIVFTEIPYQVNKADMLSKIGDLINDKKLEGISDLRDESNREGIRIVFDIKRDAMASVVLNHLYKYSALQSSFSVNNIALVNGKPETLNTLDMIRHYVDHRHEVVIRRTKYLLREAEKRAHILRGLIIAVDNIDEVVRIIRESSTPQAAMDNLMARFDLDEIQTRAILDMPLRRLTGLEIEKLKAEYDELMIKIADYQDILSNEERRMGIIRDEVAEINQKYGDERRSIIEYAAEEFRMEDMIADEDVVITISHMGYIKRTPLTEYRKQNRGGRGFTGSSTRNEDFIEHIFIASTHNYMLFFTETGKCFWAKVYEIPEAGKNSRGRAVQNMLNIAAEDKIRAYLNVKNLSDETYLNETYIMFATRQGVIKKTQLEAFSRPRANGITALNINEGDRLIEAKLTTGNSEVLLAVRSGRAIRFHESKVRAMGRSATGVRGIELDDEQDEVIGMVCVDDLERSVLVLSENGYGKRSALEDYRITNRGGKGVKTLNITDKTGVLVAITDVSDADDLMIINKSGVTIRIGVKDLRIMGRNTQGVRLIKLDDDDSIASIARVARDEEEEATDGETNTEENNPSTDDTQVTE